MTLDSLGQTRTGLRGNRFETCAFVHYIPSILCYTFHVAFFTTYQCISAKIIQGSPLAIPTSPPKLLNHSNLSISLWHIAACNTHDNVLILCFKKQWFVKITVNSYNELIVFSFSIFKELILIRDNKRCSWEVSTLVNILGPCFGLQVSFMMSLLFY